MRLKTDSFTGFDSNQACNYSISRKCTRPNRYSIGYNSNRVMATCSVKACTRFSIFKTSSRPSCKAPRGLARSNKMVGDILYVYKFNLKHKTKATYLSEQRIRSDGRVLQTQGLWVRPQRGHQNVLSWRCLRRHSHVFYFFQQKEREGTLNYFRKWFYVKGLYLVVKPKNRVFPLIFYEETFYLMNIW